MAVSRWVFTVQEAEVGRTDRAATEEWAERWLASVFSVVGRARFYYSRRKSSPSFILTWTLEVIVFDWDGIDAGFVTSIEDSFTRAAKKYWNARIAVRVEAAAQARDRGDAQPTPDWMSTRRGFFEAL